uniref:3'-5' exonuclease domain-containing protein n=1 Tax=Steinernema glaseri TaxID=37863 RepID=A0A1I7YH16_9BILA
MLASPLSKQRVVGRPMEGRRPNSCVDRIADGPPADNPLAARHRPAEGVLPSGQARLRRLDIHPSQSLDDRACAFQQIPFRRLSVRTPRSHADSVDFLSGILRRSRLSLKKLTCDFETLATIDDTECGRELNRKYFSNVEELWLLVTDDSEDLCDRFQGIEADLFTNLAHITLQLHVNHMHSDRMALLLCSFMDRFQGVEVHLELHADKATTIFANLRRFSRRPFKKVKLICTDMNASSLSLARLSEAASESSIAMENLTLRDWSLSCEAHTRLVSSAMHTLRISSCEVATVDALASALRITFLNYPFYNQARKKVTRAQTAKDLGAQIEELVERPEKLPIERLELAGQCRLVGLEYLGTKAHLEFEHRVKASVPSLVVNCDDICYDD